MYKIESGIPMPPRRVGRAPVYPWRELTPGASFVAPVPTGARPETVVNRLRASFGKWRAGDMARAGLSIACRYVPDASGAVTGIRVWMQSRTVSGTGSAPAAPADSTGDF